MLFNRMTKSLSIVIKRENSYNQIDSSVNMQLSIVHGLYFKLELLLLLYAPLETDVVRGDNLFWILL